MTVPRKVDRDDGAPEPDDGLAAPPESAADDPRHVPYEVEVPGFVGPLELLLHLIRKHKLDILDIPVSFITEKYLEYIEMMKELNLDVAAEYLEMAATLTRIKSRMLLPPDEVSGSDDEPAAEPEDPRAELVRRLLEYQKYRDAADQLWRRDVLGRDVFVREPAKDPAVPASERPLESFGLGLLLDAFAGVLRRAEGRVAHEVTVERMSVAARIHELLDFLKDRRRVRFEQLFPDGAGRDAWVVTFLALLEMTKLHLTRLAQAGPGGPLVVDFVGAVEEGGDGPAVESDFDAPREAGRVEAAAWVPEGEAPDEGEAPGVPEDGAGTGGGEEGVG
jgi:segregation and condensation protein A